MINSAFLNYMVCESDYNQTVNNFYSVRSMYDILIYLPVIKENLTNVTLKYYIKYVIYERN